MQILILDDHPIVRAGVRQLILGRWPEARVLEAGSLAEGEARVRSERPDALVLDLSLGNASGLDGLARLHRLAPGLPVLVLSMHSEEAYAARALQLGAAGYLTKARTEEELVAALERVLAGGRYITASLAERLAGLLAGGELERLPHEALSAQEHRVLLGLAAGRSVGELAEAMHLSAKTVSTYRRRVLDKLGLQNNAELTRYCLTHGLIRL